MPKLSVRQLCALFQAVSEVELSVKRPIRIGVRFSVCCYSHLSGIGADINEDGGVGGHEFLPELANTGGKVQPIDSEYEIPRLSNEQKSAVGAPLKQHIAVAVAGQGL